jgi:hypothetical protein
MKKVYRISLALGIRHERKVIKISACPSSFFFPMEHAGRRAQKREGRRMRWEPM